MDRNALRSLGAIVEDGWETASIVNCSGAQYKLGKNAVWVWKTCNGNANREKLSHEYSKAFNQPLVEAKKAVDTIISSLERIGLISLPEDSAQQ